MANMYTETADFKDPSLGQGIVKQTREQIVKKYEELSQAFPDVKDEVVSIYPSGDKHIIVEFISTGTAPDSSKFELPICTIFTFENGLIIKDFTYYDNFEE
jgi:ketosteroid isomerase-like protein